MNLSKNIRVARENIGMSQSQLAKRCNLNPSSISFFETGKRVPVARTIVNLAVCLGVSTDELLGTKELRSRFMVCPTCRGDGRVALDEHMSPKRDGENDV